MAFDKINVTFYSRRKVIINSNYFYNCILTLMRNTYLFNLYIISIVLTLINFKWFIYYITIENKILYIGKKKDFISFLGQKLKIKKKKREREIYF